MPHPPALSRSNLHAMDKRGGLSRGHGHLGSRCCEPLEYDAFGCAGALGQHVSLESGYGAVPQGLEVRQLP